MTQSGHSDTFGAMCAGVEIEATSFVEIQLGVCNLNPSSVSDYDRKE